MNEQPEFLKQSELENNQEAPAKEMLDFETKELAEIAQVIEQEKDSAKKEGTVKLLEMARLSSFLAGRFEKSQ